MKTRPGTAPGDVAIMELLEGDVWFVDTRNNTRAGRAYLKPGQTVTAGAPFGRPPFALRGAMSRDRTRAGAWHVEKAFHARTRVKL